MENNGRDNNITTRVTYVLFIIYLVILFWILLFKLGVHFSNMGKLSSINLIPFSKPSRANGKIDISEMILNVIIFVPLGIYVGILFKRWIFVKKLLLIFSISLIIEVLQFIFRLGVADITDIITNTLGGISGLMIFMAIEKLFKNSANAHKFINIFSAIGTILIILFLILLKTNNPWIRYR